MKILLVAGAFALLLSSSAVAQSGAARDVQAHRHGAAQKTARPAKMQRAPQRPQKDPWAAYWKDPSRYEFPSYGGRGGW
jgi:hypothetical protein